MLEAATEERSPNEDMNALNAVVDLAPYRLCKALEIIADISEKIQIIRQSVCYEKYWNQTA